MQQLPPIPEQPPGPPTAPKPAQPSHAPTEEPGTNPNIDVPSPNAPPPTTPVSPVG